MENNGSKQVCGMTESSYMGLMNLIFLLPSFGWILSIVLYIIGRNESETVKERGKDMMNWMISNFIYGIFLFAATAIFIMTPWGYGGIFIWVCFGLYSLICPLIAGIKALNGENWNYPFTLSILK
jgi:uncharacterized Tic20 family protein